MLGLRRAVLLASLVTFISRGAAAAAQEFPTKPIELVIPYAAGGFPRSDRSGAR